MRIRHVHDVPPATSEARGVEVRHLARVDEVELKVIDVESGSSTPFHTHPHAHEAVIVGGIGVLQLEDGERPLAPGDVLSIEPKEPHAILSRGPEPLRFVCMDCFIE